MERIIDRINSFIHHKGLSMRAFEAQAGLTNGIISTALKRKSDLSWDSVSKIVDTYEDIDIEWLITGKGQMLKSDREETSAPPVASPTTTVNKADYNFDYELPSTEEFDYINNDNNGKVPIVSELNFAISDPDEPLKIRAEDYYYVKEFRNADFMLRISGDYMAPKYRSGDLIACRHDRYNTFYQWGRIYALLTCSLGLIVGRVYEHNQNTIFIRVKPENPAYPEWDVPIDEVAKAALVVGSISLD